MFEWSLLAFGIVLGLRNESSLLEAMEMFRLAEGIIISDEEKEEKQNGKRIRYLPLWKWLLSIPKK